MTKVLLVDDSGLSRKVQAKVLRELGMETIVETKDGLEALEKLEELEYGVQLVLTDWNMPGMDGITLIQQIRKTPKGRSLPIVVVSSEFEEERIGQALQAGANSYVTKPFRKEALARKLESVRLVQGLDGADPGESVAMEGDLEKLGFAELVGFLNFSKKTGELVLEVEAGDASLSFENGEVRDARIGRFKSEQAFGAIARLKSGHFRFHEGRQPAARRIGTPTMGLLMNALRQLDEEAAGGRDG